MFWASPRLHNLTITFKVKKFLLCSGYVPVTCLIFVLEMDSRVHHLPRVWGGAEQPVISQVLLPVLEDWSEICSLPVLRSLSQHPWPHKDNWEWLHDGTASSISTHGCIPSHPVCWSVLSCGHLPQRQSHFCPILVVFQVENNFWYLLLESFKYLFIQITKAYIQSYPKFHLVLFTPCCPLMQPCLSSLWFLLS